MKKAGLGVHDHAVEHQESKLKPKNMKRSQFLGRCSLFFRNLGRLVESFPVLPHPGKDHWDPYAGLLQFEGLFFWTTLFGGAFEGRALGR